MYACLCLGLCVSVSLCHCASVSRRLCVSVSVCMYVCLCVWVSACLCVGRFGCELFFLFLLLLALRSVGWVCMLMVRFWLRLAALEMGAT